MYAGVITNDKDGVRRATSNYLHTLFKINDMKNIRIRQVEPMCTPYIVPLHPFPVSLLDPLICFCKAHGRDKQTDRSRYMRSSRPHLYAVHCDAS